jgi:tetratricopeptide (TPR) repeat protein
MAARHRIAAIVVVGALLGAETRSPAQRRPLTGAQALQTAYDAIFDARFDDVRALLDAACGTRGAAAARPVARGVTPSERAPAEACQLLEVVALGWRVLLDPQDRTRDTAFVEQADAAIDAIEAWTTREPERGEAWFYLGGAYGARAQWRVLRGERLGAARDGKRIKEALEKALALEPTLHDAWFGIGLYHYYADVAPAAARMLRWLLALPGGDKTKGMQEMLRARQSGQLLVAEADYQLHLIYLWYEKQPDRAIELLRKLRREYPRNPLFAEQTAEIESVYLQDHAASLRTWRELARDARAGRVALPTRSEARARLGIAAELDHLYESDAAIEQLEPLTLGRLEAPAWLLAQAHYQAGQALDRLGNQTAALESYRSALRVAPEDDRLDIADKSRKAMRSRHDADAATAYRLSLEGWRALERGALADAAASLRRSLAIRPDDPVVRYRYGRVLEAQGQDLLAIEAYEQVMIAGALTPPTFFAAASVDAARLYERQQVTPRAIELYRRALETIGADDRTKLAATRALSRLGTTVNESSSR